MKFLSLITLFALASVSMNTFASCGKDVAKKICKLEIERFHHLRLRPNEAKIGVQTFYNQETEYGLVECAYSARGKLGLIKIDYQSCEVVGHLIYE